MESHTWKLEWNEDMSVGIPEIDYDHKRFLFLIDELNHAITDRMSQEEVRVRLQVILDDAATHFAHEERLFREWHYPDAEEHARKHAAALLALQAIHDRLVSYGMPSEWIDVGLRVKEILLSHLLEEDMKYAEYYHSHVKERGQG